MSAGGHTIGSIETWEHPDRSFSKHIITEGTTDTAPTEGSICNVYVKFMDEYNITEDDLNGYKIDEDVEVTVGEGDTPLSELLDKCVQSMNEGETAYIKSKMDVQGQQCTEFDMKSKALKFNVILKNVSRAADISDLEQDEKFERAQHHKARGTSLYQEGNVNFAIKRFRRGLKYLLSMDPIETVPEHLKEEYMKLKCHCFLNLGACYAKQDNHESVIAQCNKALEIEAENVKGLFRRAQAYQKLDKYTEAKTDLLLAQNKEPTNKAVASLLNTVETAIKKEKDMYKKMFN